MKDQKKLKNDQLPVTDILLIFAKKIKLIFLITLFVVVFAIIHSIFIAKPVFKTSAKIMSLGGVSNSNVAGLASQFGIDIPLRQSEPKWSYSEVLKSRPIAETMIKRKYDTKKFGEQLSLMNILTIGDKAYEGSLEILKNKAINNFIKMFSINEDPIKGIYTIKLESFEAILCKEIVTDLIDVLDQHQREYNQSKTSETRKFIEERITATRNDLNNAENKLKDFTKSNRRIENSPLLQLEQQRLDREVSVLTNVYTTLKQQFETTKIEELRESKYVVVIDPPYVPLSRSKPNRKVRVILSGFLGIGLSLVIVFLLDNYNRKNKKEKDKINFLLLLFKKNILDLLKGRL